MYSRNVESCSWEQVGNDCFIYMSVQLIVRDEACTSVLGRCWKFGPERRIGLLHFKSPRPSSLTILRSGAVYADSSAVRLDGNSSFVGNSAGYGGKR